MPGDPDRSTGRSPTRAGPAGLVDPHIAKTSESVHRRAGSPEPDASGADRPGSTDEHSRCGRPAVLRPSRGMTSCRSAHLSFCRANERANQEGSRAKKGASFPGRPIPQAITREEELLTTAQDRAISNPADLTWMGEEARGVEFKRDSVAAPAVRAARASLDGPGRGPGGRGVPQRRQRASWRRVAATNPL
jgi:hypothetical protein